MKQSSELSIPPQEKTTQTEIDYRPKGIEEWVASLPRGSVGESAQRVYQVLNDFNHYDLKYQERYRSLELLREPVQYVTTSMKKHFTNVTFPQTDRSLQIAGTTRSIYDAVATGYKIIIDDIIEEKSTLQDEKLLTAAIHRVFTYLGQLLLNSYQVYEAFYNETWFELNKLYLYAEQNNLHETPVSDNMHQYITETTICEEYIRILLMYLAEPYHLHRGEIGKIYINLERWLKQSHLEKVRQDDMGALNSVPVVDLGEDMPPQIAGLMKIDSRSELLRVLKIDTLIESIKQELSTPETDISKTLIRLNLQSEALSHDLIHRLIDSWCVLKTRRFQRLHIVDRIEVSIGLNKTHKLIAQESGSLSDSAYKQHTFAQVKNTFPKQTGYSAKVVDDINGEKAGVWEIINPDAEQGVVPPDAGSSRQATVDARENLCQEDSWALVNQSAEGFCLLCVSECGKLIQVGEVIGIRRKDEQQTDKWAVGLIRWMKSYGSSGIEIGGKLLSPEAKAVGILPLYDKQDQNSLQRALLLPAVPAIKRPATLLTSSLQYRIGSQLLLKQEEDSEIKVQLTRLVGNNGLVSQFIFTPISKHSEETGGQSNKFNDVWKKL